MTWVWEHSPASGGELLVQLAIADHASDDGTNAWPSVETLARKCRVHPRTIQRSIRSLVAMGQLAVVEHGGNVAGRSRREQPNAYTVTMRHPVADRHPVAAEDAPPRQDAADPPGVGATQTIHEPSTEPSISRATPPLELVTQPGAAPDPFAAFWTAYPRKVGKPAAERAYRSAVKGGAKPDAIRAGLDLWLAYWKAARTATEYVPHPSTWLAQARWDDKPTTATATGPRAPITSQREGTSGRVTDL